MTLADGFEGGAFDSTARSKFHRILPLAAQPRLVEEFSAAGSCQVLHTTPEATRSMAKAPIRIQ